MLVLRGAASSFLASKATILPALSKTSRMRKFSLVLSNVKLLLKRFPLITGEKPLNSVVFTEPSRLGIYESSYLAKLPAEAVP